MDPVEDAAVPPEGGFAPVRRPICGGSSIAMLVGSVNLFVCTMGARSPESGTVALITAAMALVGVMLGIAGRIRREPYRGLATAGLLLNGVWLGCGGIFLLVGYVILGDMRGSDWH